VGLLEYGNERIIEKFNEIQEEIMRIGWRGILELYHPDANLDHPEAFKVFQLYKEIYENMKKRLKIEFKGDNTLAND
jgi:hypothetical protein